jgi:putative phosphoribosyl transferase
VLARFLGLSSQPAGPGDRDDLNAGTPLGAGRCVVPSRARRARAELGLGVQSVATLHIGHRVPRSLIAFQDREEAGEVLAGLVGLGRPPDPVVLALPRGGVAVGAPIADALGASLLPLVVRKLPIPISPEMGFGAVAIDGTRVLNEDVLRAFGISDSEVERITEDVMREVRRRARKYVGTDMPPDVRGRSVLVVDDGLATGFTAIVGARMVRKQKPASLTLAVPVSPADSIDAVSRFFDEIYCLYVQESYGFAVASYYRDFQDMSDQEVRSYLEGRGGGGAEAWGLNRP